MSGMEMDARQPFDDLGYSLQCPQVCAESVGTCPFPKFPIDQLQLRGIQLGLPASTASPLHGCQAALSPCFVPAAGALAAHPKYVGDCSLLQPFLEHASGSPPPLLELEEISSRPFTSFHAAIIHELAALSL